MFGLHKAARNDGAMVVLGLGWSGLMITSATRQ